MTEHEFVYAPTTRHLRRGCGPTGHVRMDAKDGRGPMGVIVYSRALTKKEVEGYALRTIDMPVVNYYVYGIDQQGNQEMLFLWDKPMPGAYDKALIWSEERGRTEDFVDYVVAPAS